MLINDRDVVCQVEAAIHKHGVTREAFAHAQIWFLERLIETTTVPEPRKAFIAEVLNAERQILPYYVPFGQPQDGIHRFSDQLAKSALEFFSQAIRLLSIMDTHQTQLSDAEDADYLDKAMKLLPVLRQHQLLSADQLTSGCVVTTQTILEEVGSVHMMLIGLALGPVNRHLVVNLFGRFYDVVYNSIANAAHPSRGN